MEIILLYFQKDSGLNNGSVTVGLMPSLRQISAVTSKGEIQFELLKKVAWDLIRALQSHDHSVITE